MEKAKVTNTDAGPQIIQMELYGHEGYAAFSGKQGVFVYHDSGEYMGKEYNKIRVCLVYKSNTSTGEEIFMQRRKLKGKDLERKPLSHQEKVGLPFALIEPMVWMVMKCKGGWDDSDSDVDMSVIQEKMKDEEIGTLGKTIGRL